MNECNKGKLIIISNQKHHLENDVATTWAAFVCACSFFCYKLNPCDHHHFTTYILSLLLLVFRWTHFIFWQIIAHLLWTTGHQFVDYFFNAMPIFFNPVGTVSKLILLEFWKLNLYSNVFVHWLLARRASKEETKK